jgi:hypothetical protein
MRPDWAKVWERKTVFSLLSSLSSLSHFFQSYKRHGDALAASGRYDDAAAVYGRGLQIDAKLPGLQTALNEAVQEGVKRRMLDASRQKMEQDAKRQKQDNGGAAAADNAKNKG